MLLRELFDVGSGDLLQRLLHGDALLEAELCPAVILRS